MERVLFAPRALPPLRLDVAAAPESYSDWVQERELGRRSAIGSPAPVRVLQLIMILADEPPQETIRTLNGLQQQDSDHWSLTIVGSSLWATSLTALLAVSGVGHANRRIRVELADDTSTPDSMFRHGLAATAGSDIALIFPGDVWADDTVSLLAAFLTPDGIVYADEDCLTDVGHHFDPRLKPAFSPELLLHCPYIGRPMAIGESVARCLVPTPGLGPVAFEHDIALRASEAADRVEHIPEVLCHRLIGPELPNDDTRHIADALQRRGIAATAAPGSREGTFQIRREPSDQLIASVIIPFRDEPRLLRACIESIDATRGSTPLEYLLIDNGSLQPETATLMERLGDRDDVRILRDERPFNWAQLNNAAAGVASGDILIFLNNDIEARTGGWVDTLCTQAQQSDVGAVGARLLYPDNRLQHCGVVVGLGGAAGHLFVGLEYDRSGYLNMATTTRECAAVTGACLATRRQVFTDLNGFDESLGIDLNDIDYCMRVQVAGLRVVYEAAAELTHYESPSRGTAGDVRDILHFIDRWRSSIMAGDPYLNAHLTRADSSCALRSTDEADRWNQWVADLTRA